MNPKISILLPIYNEKENILTLLSELTTVMDAFGRAYEIIAVDDGSKDGSREILESASKTIPQLKVIFFRINTGQTAALDAGMRHASGEYVVTMDADRQNDPKDIPSMIKLLDEGYDCVMGHRHKRQDNVFYRKVPSRIANFLIRRLWKSQLHDLGCAVKAFKVEVSRELRLYGEMHRFIGLLMEQTGAKVIEYKVNHRPRVAGKSKYNLSRTFKVVLDLVTLWFLKSYQTKPIYIFGGAGIFCTFLSFVTVNWTLFDKLVLGIVVHRNPLFLIAIFMAVVGVQFLVMGLLAEMLTRTYFESTDQLPYSILKKFNFDSTESSLRLVK